MERRLQATMKRRIISALLAGALCALSVAPAGAVDEAPSAVTEPEQSQQTQTEPGALTEKRMGLRAVRTAVEENNPTVQALHKTAAGIGSTGSGAAGSSDGEALSPVVIYQGLIEDIENAMAAMEESGQANTDLYHTYEAQKTLLENQMNTLVQSMESMAAQGEMALLQLEDAAYQLSRQADNVAGQLAMGAQTMLVSIRNLECTGEQLERQLDALDRNIAVMEVQLEIGMISQLQLDTVRNQRENLAQSIQTLDSQCEDLGCSLALLCGYDADTVVVPSSFAPVGTSDLREMDYEDDLATALKNSFSIWQSRNTLRQAQNAYDEDIASTEYAVQSAQQALEAEQDNVRASFDTLYKTVQDSILARDAAETAEEQAELDFYTSTVEYNRGMISRLEYLQAQDTLEDAKLDVDTAQLSLRMAYIQYEWALEGVMTTATAASA